MTHTITPRDLAMARTAARKYHRAGETRCDADFESAAIGGLYEASRTFNGTGSWQAYARRRINSRLANLLRRTIGPMRDHLTTVAPEDLPDTIAPAPHEITNPALNAALQRLPKPEQLRLLSGDIDRRRPRDRELLHNLRVDVFVEMIDPSSSIIASGTTVANWGQS